MNFRESEEYLVSLGNEVEAMKLGLENVTVLLAALGNPQNNYLKVQVAGTNGKGSVCAFLNSICLRAGIKTGMFTSPHLVSITERVQIDGVDVSEDEFARLATHVRKVSERLVADRELENVPTFFEQVTAIALLAFAEANVELAILETGLGGRLDATTAATAEICAITRVDFDHQRHLGETLAEIAAEKAAIIRADSKVVIGEQSDDAMAVILLRCSDLGVRPLRAHSLPLVFPPVCLGLAGRHQIENAKIVILLSEILRESFPITSEGIVDGLKHARHPGRLDWMGRFLLDGAHNVGGAKALRAYLDEFVIRPITLIFGAMREKSVAEMAEILWPRAEHIILTRPDNSRAMTAEELEAFTPASISRERVVTTQSAAEAMKKAEEVSSEDSLILVTGSLYLVGEVRRSLFEI